MSREPLLVRLRGEGKWWEGLDARASGWVVDRAGRMSAVVLHVLWFGTWVVFAHKLGIDKYPYQFLTVTVSLEAIFLSLFILISQRNTSEALKVETERVQEATRANLEAILANSKALLQVIEAVRHEMGEQDEILDELKSDLLEPRCPVCNRPRSLPSCGADDFHTARR